MATDLNKLGSEFNAEWVLQNQAGSRLYCKCWNHEAKDPKAVVFICHGYGEHLGPYNVLADLLTKENILVVGHDHVSHGQSEGERGDIKDLQQFVQDVIQHIEIVQQKFPKIPVFIIGHSLGGLISCSLALQNENLLTGMVLIGPCLELPHIVGGSALKLLLKVVNRITPSLRGTSLDPALISHDKAVVEEYVSDPLVFHGRMNVRTVVSILTVMDYVVKNFEKIKLPFLNIHGDEDGLCDISGSRTLDEKSSSLDKQLSVYKGAYHQVHREPEGVAETCRKEIVGWIQKRI